MPAYKDNKTGKWFCKFYYTDWQGNNRQKWKRGKGFSREAVCQPGYDFSKSLRTLYGGYDRPSEAVNYPD